MSHGDSCMYVVIREMCIYKTKDTKHISCFESALKYKIKWTIECHLGKHALNLYSTCFRERFVLVRRDEKGEQQVSSFWLTCELRHEGDGEPSKFPQSAPQIHGERRHTSSSVDAYKCP